MGTECTPFHRVPKGRYVTYTEQLVDCTPRVPKRRPRPMHRAFPRSSSIRTRCNDERTRVVTRLRMFPGR